ncbi:MAG: hypothetical protein HY305_05400 [Sphingobacteriales bacterium]|nr:hypothetical protein [Sphingobacteriales bacterium]
MISNESNVNNLRLHADISYINQEKFTITAGITFNGYAAMKDNARAWGTIPLQVNAALRWLVFKNLMIKSDLNAFSGGPYVAAIPASLGGGVDFSAGAEYSLSKKVSLWLNVNNIFNNKYQRWYNYPVYGINVLGGVLIKF